MRHEYPITSLPEYGSAQVSNKHGSELKFLASTFSLHITCCLSTRGKERGATHLLWGRIYM